MNAGAGQGEGSRAAAFAILAAGASLTILDLTKVNVALPTLETELHATPGELQWIVGGYALAFGLVLVASGRLGDRGSRKRIFLVGIAAFGVASLLCGLAPTASTLAVARAVQGATAGLVMPQVYGAIQQLYEPRERGRIFGILGAVIGASTAFGPALAGALIDLGGPDFGWRFAFWINVPIVVALLPFAKRRFPAHQHHAKSLTIDPVGIGLFGAAALCLMLPFVLTSGRDSDDPARWFWLIGAAVMTVLFIGWERAYRSQGKSPVLDPALLGLHSYRNGLLIITAYYSALPAIFIVTTLYLQHGLGLSAFLAGLVSMPFSLLTAWSAWLSGKLLDRLGRALPRLGLAVAFVGFGLALLAAVTVPPPVTPWAIACTMCVAGLGGGALVASNQALMLEDVPLSAGGLAASFAQVSQRVGNAIGVAAVLSAYFATLANPTPAELPLDTYRHALANGFGIALALVVVAFVFAMADRDRLVKR